MFYTVFSALLGHNKLPFRENKWLVVNEIKIVLILSKCLMLLVYCLNCICKFIFTDIS